MTGRKPLDWIGSSKKDLIALPIGVKQKIGHSLHLAQIEVDDEDTKPLKGFGSSDVREIVKSDSEGTYRAVYTVKFEEKIYVLHIFKKKSKTGKETPKKDTYWFHFNRTLFHALKAPGLNSKKTS